MSRVVIPGAQNSHYVCEASHRRRKGGSFDMMIVPEAANMPPTPWQTEILASGTCAGAMPRIWRTLSCNAYMPYMPECM